MTEEELQRLEEVLRIRKQTPLPWRIDGDTAYDATDTYVLATWFQDTHLIVEAVNAFPVLIAEVRRLRAREDDLNRQADRLANWRELALDRHRDLHEVEI